MGYGIKGKKRVYRVEDKYEIVTVHERTAELSTVADGRKNKWVSLSEIKRVHTASFIGMRLDFYQGASYTIRHTRTVPPFKTAPTVRYLGLWSYFGAAESYLLSVLKRADAGSGVLDAREPLERI